MLRARTPLVLCLVSAAAGAALALAWVKTTNQAAHAEEPYGPNSRVRVPLPQRDSGRMPLAEGRAGALRAARRSDA